MGFNINGDIIPSVSGFANLGVEVGPNGPDAFDITELRPFGQIHQVSGIFHDPLLGQSGVLRFSLEQASFQVSVDGGLTFQNLSAGGVDSVGVVGDADLTGHVDLASPSSGFLAIFDTADASPIQFAVDQLGLSGLWDFPTQGFNGRVVNAVTDFNGTEAQGVLSLVGASGITVDIVGQTVTISTSFDGGIATCYAEGFNAATSWVVSHNLNTEDVHIIAYNSDTVPKRVILPDSTVVTDSNTVTITFNTPQAGQAVIIGCKS